MTIIVTVAIALLTIALVALADKPGALDSIGQVATDLFRPFVAPFVTLINKPAFAYVASLIIVLSAIIVLSWFVFALLRPQLRGIRQARAEISALPEVSSNEWLNACESVAAVLQRHDALVPAWRTYAADVVQRKRIPDHRLATVLDAQGSARANSAAGFLVGLPGFYTSIGLILTFVGLVVALYFSARGFRSGDINEARQAIVQLLNASAFKFLTSVAALFSALMISLFHRYGSQALESETAELAGEIDAYLQPARTDRAELGLDGRFGQLAEAITRLSAELATTRNAITSLEASFQQRDAR